jgi:hypothetical protein
MPFNREQIRERLVVLAAKEVYSLSVQEETIEWHHANA